MGYDIYMLTPTGKVASGLEYTSNFNRFRSLKHKTVSNWGGREMVTETKIHIFSMEKDVNGKTGRELAKNCDIALKKLEDRGYKPWNPFKQNPMPHYTTLSRANHLCFMASVITKFKKRGLQYPDYVFTAN